jgi:hypothetical protein
MFRCLCTYSSNNYNNSSTHLSECLPTAVSYYRQTVKYIVNTERIHKRIKTNKIEKCSLVRIIHEQRKRILQRNSVRIKIINKIIYATSIVGTRD